MNSFLHFFLSNLSWLWCLGRVHWIFGKQLLKKLSCVHKGNWYESVGINCKEAQPICANTTQYPTKIFILNSYPWYPNLISADYLFKKLSVSTFERQYSSHYSNISTASSQEIRSICAKCWIVPWWINKSTHFIPFFLWWTHFKKDILFLWRLLSI